MTFLAWSTLLGATLGVGLWSLFGLAPGLSRPRFAKRVAPYLADVSEGARDFVAHKDASPLPVIGSVLSPLLGPLQRLLSALGSSAETLTLRLRQANSSFSSDAFRSRQLAWATAGAAAGGIFSIALSQVRPGPPVIHLLLVVVTAAGGYLLPDQLLKRKARARLSRMSDELPVVLEFLTLSLSAGEGILDSLRRVALTSRGELAGELGGVVATVHSGSGLSESLRQLAAGIRLAAFTRCVDQLIGALERGTPLTDVLRAQAQDAREQAKRDLIDLAGRKEVAMMIPLVFMILPVTIIFAVFPGIFVLQVGF